MYFVPHFGHAKVFETSIFSAVFGKTLEKENLNFFSAVSVKKRWRKKNDFFFCRSHLHHRTLPFIGERKKIFKFIFTTVFWGEKIYSNLFLPPKFLGEKIYLNLFSPPYFLGENIFKHIFSPKNTVVKFSPSHLVHRTIM